MKILFFFLFSIFTISSLSFEVIAAPGDDSKSTRSLLAERSSSKEENNSIVGSWRVSCSGNPSLIDSCLVYFLVGTYNCDLRIKTRSGLSCESQMGTWGKLYVLNGIPKKAKPDSDSCKRTSRKKLRSKAKKKEKTNVDGIAIKARGVWYHPNDGDERKNILWEMIKIDTTSVKSNLSDCTPEDGKEIPIDDFIFNMTKINKLSGKELHYQEMDMRDRSAGLKVFNTFQAERVDSTLTEDQVDALPTVITQDLTMGCVASGNATRREISQRTPPQQHLPAIEHLNLNADKR